LIDAKRRDLEASGIGTIIKISLDLKTGASSGGTNEVEDGVVVGEGLTSPVFADFAEETVFGGVPFGSAGRIVANGDGEAETVAEKALELILPKIARAVAATGVGEDQELGSERIANAAIAVPPGTDRRDSEGSGIVRGTNENGAAIVKNIVDAIGDGVTDGP